MHDFEKLGAFYLGKRYDEGAGKLTEELVLYDSKDLTTHAVIIGMTGSGKTGLGIGLLEEAAKRREDAGTPVRGGMDFRGFCCRPLTIGAALKGANAFLDR